MIKLLLPEEIEKSDLEWLKKGMDVDPIQTSPERISTGIINRDLVLWRLEYPDAAGVVLTKETTDNIYIMYLGGQGLVKYLKDIIGFYYTFGKNRGKKYVTATILPWLAEKAKEKELYDEIVAVMVRKEIKDG